MQIELNLVKKVIEELARENPSAEVAQMLYYYCLALKELESMSRTQASAAAEHRVMLASRFTQGLGKGAAQEEPTENW